MISAILLAWAPTSAYAGISDFTVTTIDRKGNTGLSGVECSEFTTVFVIDIRGKGDFSYDGFGGETQPIFKKTGIIEVTFNLETEKITSIIFKKNSGSQVFTITGAVGTTIQIDAKIGNKVLCGHDIPKGTNSLSLSI